MFFTFENGEAVEVRFDSSDEECCVYVFDGLVCHECPGVFRKCVRFYAYVSLE